MVLDSPGHFKVLLCETCTHIAIGAAGAQAESKSKIICDLGGFRVSPWSAPAD